MWRLDSSSWTTWLSTACSGRSRGRRWRLWLGTTKDASTTSSSRAGSPWLNSSLTTRSGNLLPPLWFCGLVITDGEKFNSKGIWLLAFLMQRKISHRTKLYFIKYRGHFYIHTSLQEAGMNKSPPCRVTLNLNNNPTPTSSIILIWDDALAERMKKQKSASVRRRVCVCDALQKPNTRGQLSSTECSTSAPHLLLVYLLF